MRFGNGKRCVAKGEEEGLMCWKREKREERREKIEVKGCETNGLLSVCPTRGTLRRSMLSMRPGGYYKCLLMQVLADLTPVASSNGDLGIQYFLNTLTE